MASLSIFSPAICTTKVRWEGVQVRGAVLLADPPAARQLPVVRSPVSKSIRLSESRTPLAGKTCQTRRLSSQPAHSSIPHQFAVRAAAADDRRAQASPGAIARFDEQPAPVEQTEKETETETLSSEEIEKEKYREQANEPLNIGEENSLPMGPAGGRQYDERDPATELAEAESKEGGITVEDAYLMPLSPNSLQLTDLERNQERGWSESSCDEGSILHHNNNNKSSAAAAVGASSAGSEELLIERLLESLPLYDGGRSAEHYRIRALVYGKIGDYFSKGEGRAQGYGVVDNKRGAMDVKVLTAAVQQLADLILAEDSRTAADYNCRAQFFQKSAEMFCFSGGDGDGERPAAYMMGGEEERMEGVLQQLEDVMLSDSGRSVDDYNRRANVFGKTADALSAGRSEAASGSMN